MKENRSKVAIIENADDPKTAAFIIGEGGKRRLFDSRDDAEEWLSDYAKSGVDYRTFDGTD